MRWCYLCAMVFCWVDPVHGGSICINEVLYDPVGGDAGYEFVELYNNTDQSRSLAGWTLEAGNGARPGDWRVQWRGSAPDYIAPRAHFLIAGEDVVAAADARATLALQNGPDAVRLVAPDGRVDCIGWGALEEGEFCEGYPAPDVAAGVSLARIPDGTDTDRNDHDLQMRSYPTPGAPNAVARQIAIARVYTDPPIIDIGESGKIRAELINLGLEPLILGEVQLDLEVTALAAASPHGQSGSLGSEETCTIIWDAAATGDPGSHRGCLRARAPQCPEQLFCFDLRIGRGVLLISEIQYDPAAGEGEWIELYNRGIDAIDLTGWTLADHSGRTVILTGAQAPLMPGAMVLVAQDSEGLRARWPTISGGRIVRYTGAWPTLNNSLDRAFGYADEIMLRAPDGPPVDYVRYVPSDLDGNGISLERWISAGDLVEPRTLIPCSSPGGATPGDAGWLAEAEQGELHWLSPRPNPFRPEGGPGDRFCRIAVPTSIARGTRVTADLFSMAGRRVATLTAGAEVHGAHLLLWDGRSATGEPLPTGLYLLRIFLRARDGSAERAYVKSLTLLRG